RRCRTSPRNSFAEGKRAWPALALRNRQFGWFTVVYSVLALFGARQPTSFDIIPHVHVIRALQPFPRRKFEGRASEGTRPLPFIGVDESGSAIDLDLGIRKKSFASDGVLSAVEVLNLGIHMRPRHLVPHLICMAHPFTVAVVRRALAWGDVIAVAVV